MDAPPIQYAKTEDGVSIAFATAGRGDPVIYIGGFPAANHCQLIWNAPPLAPFAEELAASRQVVVFDVRGTGSSPAYAGPLSVDGLLLDLAAVLERLKIERFDVMCASTGAVLAVAFAVRHPTRVNRIVMLNGLVKPADLLSTPVMQALGPLAGKDLGTFNDNIALLSQGWRGDQAKRFSELAQAAASPDAVRHYIAFLNRVDVTEDLPKLSSRTLMIAARGTRNIPTESITKTAAMIPNAELLVIDGLMSDNLERVVPAALDFLGASPSGQVLPSSLARGNARDREARSGTVTILFLDIVDSTALTERQGDAAFRARSRQLDETLRRIAREHGGTPVEGKVLGDGVMATFASARKAIEAALACNEAAATTDLCLHLGLHAGDVIHEDDNVYGGAVNLAARVCGLSAPGEVLVSETVRALARTSAGVRFEDRGLYELKGIEEPQRLFAVRQA